MKPKIYHAGRKPRVALVLEATIAGTKRHVFDLATRLPREGFDVTVVCSTRRRPLSETDRGLLVETGAHLAVLDMHRGLHPLSDAVACWRLARLFRRIRPDIAHAHSSKAGFLGRAAARLAGVRRAVYTPHAFHFQGCRTRPGRAFYAGLERLAARWGDCLVAVSEGERRLAVRHRIVPEARVVCIRNGVEPLRWRRLPDRATARRVLGVPFDAPLACSVGRLVRQKSLDVSLQAAALARREHPGLRWLVCGEGPERQRLEALARGLGLAEHVRFAGHREDVATVYAAADVLLASSLYEGMSYTVLEAMAAGLPVVASRAAGTEEAVRDGETGILAAPGDPASLAAGLGVVLGDAGRARRMGGAGRARVTEAFSLDRQVRETAALYRALLAR